MIQSGINVCLGTDGGCSNNSLDMLSEMQYAALLAKAVSKNSCAVDAYTALKMATRNGARALGRLHDLGMFEKLVTNHPNLSARNLAGTSFLKLLQT